MRGLLCNGCGGAEKDILLLILRGPDLDRRGSLLSERERDAAECADGSAGFERKLRSDTERGPEEQPLRSGAGNRFEEITCRLENACGTHSLCFVFRGEAGRILRFEDFRFEDFRFERIAP